jgi:EmrB/QacA subfamily drug resistance transporter
MNTAAAQSVKDELRSPWLILCVVAIGSFMTILDATVVNVAVPALQHQYVSSTAQVQWVISCYALALGVGTPMAASIGNRFGPKKVYLVSLGVFTGSSLLCGLAPNLGLLIASRGVQGLAGGFALPLGIVRLLAAFSPDKRGRAFGVFGIVLVFAPMIGPVLGGAFAGSGLTSWIFFVNVPIGAVGIILGTRIFHPDPAEDAARGKIRFLSVMLTLIGFGGVLIGSTMLASPGRGPLLVVLSFAVGVVALLSLAVLEWSSPDPVLNLKLYRIPSYLLSTGINTIGQVCLFGVQFLIPLSLQVISGFSPLSAGLALLPMAMASGLTGLLAGWFHDRVGPRLPLVIGLLLLITGIAVLRIHLAHPDRGVLIWSMLVAGAGAGAIPPIVQVAAVSHILRPDLSNATSLLQAVQRLSQALGVAVLATIVARDVPDIGLDRAYLVTLVAGASCVLLAACLPGWPGHR